MTSFLLQQVLAVLPSKVSFIITVMLQITYEESHTRNKKMETTRMGYVLSRHLLSLAAYFRLNILRLASHFHQLADLAFDCAFD